MNSRNAVSILALSSVLAACSSSDENKIALGDFEYVKVEQIEPLKLPAGFDSPNYTETYKVAGLKEDQIDVVGPQVDVRAPTQVIAVSEGSRLEEGSPLSQVWIDKVYEDEALDAVVWRSVEAYLQRNGINHTPKTATELTTDWIRYDENPDLALFNDIGTDKSFKFKYNWEMKSHARSGLLTVNVTDFIKTKSQEDLMLSQDKLNLEAEILNQTLLNYSLELRKVTNALGGGYKSNLKIEQGEDADGNPALIVASDKVRLWSNMTMLLEYLRFDVIDQNRNQLSYTVEYEKPETSVWESIWGESVPELPIDAGQYVFKVGEIEDQASITILDSDGNSISPALMNQAFESLKNGLLLTDR